MQMMMRQTRDRMAAVVVALMGTVAAQAAPHVTLAPGSTLVLHGKSTLHDYHSTATRIELAVDLGTTAEAASPLASLSQPGAVRGVVLTIPVQAMKSDKDGLDKNMQKALKASANPNIVFRLSAPPAPGAWSSDGSTVSVRGTLEVAGQAREIEVPLRASWTAEGIVLEGRKSLLMSDYGIKPPSMMLGTLKTADAVAIEFRLVLAVDGF
jgi:hypothetical protein